MDIRIFLRPSGEKWVDIRGVPSDATVASIASVLNLEGYIFNESVYIPKDSIYMILAVNDPPKANLTVFPGGNKEGA